MYNIYKEIATRCARFFVHTPTSEIVRYHQTQSSRNTTRFLAVKCHIVSQLFIMLSLWTAHLISLQPASITIFNTLAC